MPLESPKRNVTDAENKLRLLCCVDALGSVTPAQLWPFVASLELMDYIPMQLLLHELMADGDVETGTGALREQLFLTQPGRAALRLFDGRIMQSDRQQIQAAAAPYRTQLLQKARVQAVYESAQAGEYRVRLCLQEGELPLLELRLSTPHRDMAAAAIAHFQQQAAPLLMYLYGLGDGASAPPAKERAALSTLVTHSRHEHMVTAPLPHPQAEILLSLLLPDLATATAYQEALARPSVAQAAAQRLVALLCTP